MCVFADELDSLEAELIELERENSTLPEVGSDD